MFLFLFLFCFRVGLMRKLQMSTDASLGPCDLALVYNYSATTPTGAIPSVSAASASIGRGVAIIHIHADTTAQKVQQVQQQEKEKINKMKWPKLIVAVLLIHVTVQNNRHYM